MAHKHNGPLSEVQAMYAQPLLALALEPEAVIAALKVRCSACCAHPTEEKQMPTQARLYHRTYYFALLRPKEYTFHPETIEHLCKAHEFSG